MRLPGLRGDRKGRVFQLPGLRGGWAGLSVAWVEAIGRAGLPDTGLKCDGEWRYFLLPSLEMMERLGQRGWAERFPLHLLNIALSNLT